MYGLRHLSKGMIAALILSVMIAFMISLVPSMEIFKVKQEFPVFSQQKQVYLNENNIVNFIASFPVEMQIKKVSWKDNILSIDFLIHPDTQIDTNNIYKDLYTAIKKGLVQSSNVNEILLRVFLNDMENKHNKIFVAISAQKKDIINNPSMTIEPTMMYKDFLENYFGLTFGNLIR